MYAIQKNYFQKNLWRPKQTKFWVCQTSLETLVTESWIERNPRMLTFNNQVEEVKRD